MKTNIELPAAQDIESSVLGAIILENDCLDKITLIISPKVFFVDVNKIIYSTMIKMYNAGIPIDSITLYEELKSIGKEVNASYLSKLTRQVTSSVNAPYHARILVEKWLLRELIKKSTEVIQEVEAGLEDPFLIHSNAIKNFESILEEFSINSNEKTLWDEFPDVLNKIEDSVSNNKEVGLISSSFPSFNKMTSGVKEGDFVTIYGYEKQGKTTLALQLLLDFAIQLKVPVGFFSLEMSKESIYFKSFSLRTGIEYNKLRSPKINKLTPEDMKEFIPKAVKCFEGTKIYVCDKELEKHRIKAKMKLWKRKFGVKVFVIDYISLIPSSEKYERRDLEIGAISRFFKIAAKELEVTVLMLSQSNKEGKVAESKALSRDADFVISIKKPVEHAMKEIKIGGGTFKFNDNHFLVTLEYSRHGKNLFQFICGYTKSNEFKEIDAIHENAQREYQ